MSILEDLLDEYGVEYITEGQNSSKDFVNINCIAGDCIDDHKHKLGIHRSLGRAYCWSCGAHKIYDVVKELGIPWKIWKPLMEEEMEEWGLEDNTKKYKTELPPVPKGIEVPGEPLTEIHKQYLKSRGFDPDWLEKEYGVKGTVKNYSDFSLSYRIVFPITYNNIPISFIARTYLASETKRRYRAAYPEEELISHKSKIFNCDKATGDRILLVEGLIDALKLIYASKRFNIGATYGTAYTPEQLLFLREHYKEVIVMYDPEPLAQKHAQEIVSYLKSYGVRAKSLSLKGYEDPGALDLKIANKIVNYLLDMEWRD